MCFHLQFISSHLGSNLKKKIKIQKCRKDFEGQLFPFKINDKHTCVFKGE